MSFERNSEPINGWRVHHQIDWDQRANTYRIVDARNKPGFLKIFSLNGLKNDRSDSTLSPIELVIRESLDCPGIPKNVQSGVLSSDGRPYLITEFITGETLDKLLYREFALSEIRAKPLMRGLLEVAAHLHSMEDPIVHGALLPVNCIVEQCKDYEERLVLVGFRYARRQSDVSGHSLLPVDSHFVPNECFEGASNSPATDVFSLGATYFKMLFAAAPWEDETATAESKDLRYALLEARKHPLRIPTRTLCGELASSSRKALQKALCPLPDDRFEHAGAFLEALSETASRKLSTQSIANRQVDSNSDKPKGFAAIAGMTELKRILAEDFINVLREPDLYRQFGLTIPNGMLLFGPPGCGKTFIAERLGEELGISFRQIRPSSVASTYIHGTQQRIAQLFDVARDEAPCLLFLDEMDALVPRRSGDLQHAYAAEVNEWLIQLSNSGEAGVFLLAATNQPRRIDPAVLRSGRLDKVVYVGPPDHEARRAIFELHLSRRPLDHEIDLDELARMTHGRVASDIKFLVDEAARHALTSRDNCIRMSYLQGAIRQSGPTVGPSVLAEYEKMRIEFESQRSINQPIQRGSLRN